ncbi:uncharacterized protein EKO05_0005116 [Ascochyta rabiei]|nr:uncharacterized protein EKO05_0005116 [Ascochyta rabiei]UPX14639.1 hypothetical protein EKO05_0005116 [Ascochyta rabiei]
MAQPWGVSAIEKTTESHDPHTSPAHRLGQALKNAVTPESSAATKARDARLEEEHSVSQEERAAAFEPGHRVAGTNLTVGEGMHGGAGRK